MKQEDIESECLFTAAQYREWWLESEHALGQVAETLADVLGWQRSEDQPLPDALELAQVAAACRLTTA